jgi:hypothetical protein
VLQLAIADEQLGLPPKWLTRAEYVLNAYRRNWAVFSSSHVVSALAPRRLVSSSLVQMSVAELWYLRDILGRTVNKDEANAFVARQGLMLWRTPHSTRHGRV